MYSDYSPTQPVASRDEIELAPSVAHNETEQLRRELDKMKPFNEGPSVKLNKLVIELEQARGNLKSSDEEKNCLTDQLYNELPVYCSCNLPISYHESYVFI